MTNSLSVLLAALLLLVMACEPIEDEAPALGGEPTEEDVTFTFEYSMENANIVNFNNTSEGFILEWDLGNGTTAEGQEVTGVYPLAGEYTVTLTVYFRGGSASSSQTITIDQTDPTLLDREDFNLLTGGVDALEGKTWVIDGERAGHMGVGPASGPDAGSPVFWEAPPLDKAGQGLYDDRITFKLLDFEYDYTTNGDIFVNGASAGDFGGDPANGDQTASYTAPDDLTWNIVEEGDKKILTISDGGFFGFYTGVSRYEILTLSENELYVRYLDAQNPDLAWYHRLVPEGFTPPPPPDPETVSEFSVDFESEEPSFSGFGGSTYQVIDNPDASGINTSGRVGETVHGAEPWAGISTALPGALDFDQNNGFRMKVWGPVTGTIMVKLEASGDPNNFREEMVEYTEANTWQELTFDFTDSPSGEWDVMALFFAFGNTDPNTFYFDDIEFINTNDTGDGGEGESGLTASTIHGDGTKAWTLAPQAAALAVGPAKGSSEWFSNAADEVDGLRACAFNDEYIFGSDGSFTYDAMGDIYAETYMGVTADGCISEEDVPADAQAWTSGTHQFSLTPATDSEPAYLTVTGTGAFIGLPKVYNGGEYAAAPPDADAAVTYEVLSYENTGGSEKLVLTIDVSEGQQGTIWWTFTLQH